MGIDIGLAVIRIFIGYLLMAHGFQKVTYLFGGKGLQGGIEEFKGDGFRGGMPTALAAGAGQIGAGIFLMLGLLTPVAGLVAASVMTVAATVKIPHGMWVQDDGVEYPLVLIVIVSALAISGPGQFSIDALLGITQLPYWVGIIAALLGIVTGLMTRALLHRPASAHEPTTT